MGKLRVNDAVHWFMSDLTSRVVAESGIPTDRFHFGKIILRSFKDYPDAVMQIDGATGESDTNASILKKSAKCATCFRNIGLKPGDVMVLMAPNHIALSVPFYAALYTGVVIAPVDVTLGVKELQNTFNVNRPKIIFCQSEKTSDIRNALKELGHTADIITFDKGDTCSLEEFMEKHADDTPVEDFKATDFDAESATILILPTSGSTGLPKGVEVSHKNFSISLPQLWSLWNKFPGPTAMSLLGSPLQWMTAILNFLCSPMFKFTRLQSSSPLTQAHACYLINKYKPTYTLMSPTFMTTLMKEEFIKSCDFSGFETIHLGGSVVPATLLEDLKKVMPNTTVMSIYGMSELAGMAFHSSVDIPVSSGTLMSCFEYRLIDINTLEDIDEPNVSGELWLKGPSIIKRYYNNDTATKEAFTEDGWLKTGDIFYRDEQWYFFYVDRLKMILKYKSHQISPVEVENVIRQHPGILDVAVTGIPDPECGDLLVACVVKKEGCNVTADEIKQLVKDSLADAKQLRGGVIFLNSIPLTPSTKVNRKKLKEIVEKLDRQ